MGLDSVILKLVVQGMVFIGAGSEGVRRHWNPLSGSYALLAFSEATIPVASVVAYGIISQEPPSDLTKYVAATACADGVLRLVAYPIRAIGELRIGDRLDSIEEEMYRKLLFEPTGILGRLNDFSRLYVKLLRS